jgi:hypothetical protein
MVKIEFEIVKDGMTFRDAIVLPIGHGFTDEQLEELKQKRFNDWYAIVTAPQPEEIVEEQTEEE